VTEQLLTQQLESPSGTGRVEPRSETSLSDADTNERDANRHTPILTGSSGADLESPRRLWNLSRCWWVDDDVGISTEPAATQRPSITFDDFYSDVWPRAFRLGSFLTHDTQAGEDIAQEVLAAMSRRWDLLERPDAYLQRGLTNASWNWNRRGRIATRKLPLLAVHSGNEFRFDELADAIARLPFRQRAVIVLRYYGDLTETDIAHALDCRPGTVKSLASRALAALSKEIAP
jgi:RNA polymerase sigma factor (sigma-70 family)